MSLHYFVKLKMPIAHVPPLSCKLLKKETPEFISS